MGDCKKRVTRRECEEKQQQEPKVCPQIEFCAGNQTIIFDGECLRAEPRTEQIPDGTFSAIRFENGCIVGVGHLPVPSYTPSPCAADVGGGTSPVAADVVLSQNPSNLLRETPDGLAVQPVFRGVDGVSIRGTGTSTDPIVIALAKDDGSSGCSINTLTPEAIEVSTGANGATNVSLKTVIQSGMYGQFRINEYGQVVEVDTEEPPIVSITAVSPLKVEVNDGRALISLEDRTTGASGEFISKDSKRIVVTDGLITDIIDLRESSDADTGA